MSIPFPKGKLLDNLIKCGIVSIPFDTLQHLFHYINHDLWCLGIDVVPAAVGDDQLAVCGKSQHLLLFGLPGTLHCYLFFLRMPVEHGGVTTRGISPKGPVSVQYRASADPLVVEVSSIAAVEVFNLKIIVNNPDQGMAPGDQLILQLDVAIGSASNDRFRGSQFIMDLVGFPLKDDQPGRRSRFRHRPSRQSMRTNS